MERDERRILALCDFIRETAFAFHAYLRHGHLEKVYENGMANRLRKPVRLLNSKSPFKSGTKTERFLATTTRT
jgi:hypothetical protein